MSTGPAKKDCWRSTAAAPGATRPIAEATIQDFRLLQNYPNPFYPGTVINYELSTFSHVDVSIYNMLGQKVATLVSGLKPAGCYKMEWHAAGFPSGVSFCRMETKSSSHNSMAMRKMLLLR